MNTNETTPTITVEALAARILALETLFAPQIKSMQRAAQTASLYAQVNTPEFLAKVGANSLAMKSSNRFRLRMIDGSRVSVMNMDDGTGFSIRKQPYCGGPVVKQVVVAAGADNLKAIEEVALTAAPSPAFDDVPDVGDDNIATVVE